MSEGWPKDYLRGSTVYKSVIWTKEDESEEEGYACIVCGDFVPDGALNAEYDTHELLHIRQADIGLIQPPRRYAERVFREWDLLDEKFLPEGVKWKK